MGIGIVDCGSGNLASIENAFRYLGVETEIVSTPKQVKEVDRIVLPGVGFFGYFMKQLRANGLEEPIKKAVMDGTPYLGICLGMQILFRESRESPGVSGLGILEGEVVKFQKGKVPQTGWNKILPQTGLLEGYAYFTNSYYCKPENEKYVAAVTDYFGNFASAVKKDNIFAVQFHPEKSGKYGLALLKRWVEC